MENYRIVKAERDRMPEVAKVMRSSFRSTYPTFPELHTDEEDRAYFTTVIFDKDDVYVGEDPTGRIVGFIAFNDEFIDHLYLLPEAQWKGLGSSLLKIALENTSRKRLWTFQENLPARSFYTKHGFVAIRETDGDNEEGRPDVLFEWTSRSLIQTEPVG